MANSMVQWLLMASIAMFHPFFVSVIEINHNAKDATAEISIRVFTEDIEKTLQKYNRSKIDIVHPKDKKLIDEQLAKYIENTLQLSINGKPVKLNYIGYEIIKESVWTYFEVEGIKDIRKLDANCRFLYDFENSQINIFHVKANGLEKSFKLDYPKQQTHFEF